MFEIIRNFRQMRIARQTDRIVGNLPQDIRKDIGWPARRDEMVDDRLRKVGLWGPLR